MLDFFQNINLPFYVIITFFFAYIIWSKFFNNDELIPKNINDVLILFSIFTCLFIFLIFTVISFASIIMILLDSIDLSLVLQKIYYGIPLMIAILSLSGIWLFAGRYANEKCSKKDLEEMANYIIVYLVLLFLSFMPTMFFLILKTPLFYYFYDIIFILFIILFLITICYLTINNVLFKIDLKTLLFTKLVFMIALIMGGIITFIFLLSIPSFNYNEPIYEKYQIYESNSFVSDVYVQAKIPIDVETFGSIGSFVSLIAIPYGEYGFETEGDAGNNFKILINSTNENEILTLIDGFNEIKTFKDKKENKFSFYDTILLEDKEVLILKFNPNTIKDENIETIIVGGYIKKNISRLNYAETLNNYCNSENCSIILNITNNLDLPVFRKKDTILNFNNTDIMDTSNCRFTNITSDFVVSDNSRISEDCGVIDCTFEIKEFHKGNSFDIGFIMIDKTIIKMNYIDMKKPIDINLQLDLEC